MGKNMVTTAILKKELKTIVKESIREIFEQESIKFRALALPFISQREQKDIEKRYSRPSRRIAKSIEIET